MPVHAPYVFRHQIHWLKEKCNYYLVRKRRYRWTCANDVRLSTLCSPSCVCEMMKLTSFQWRALRSDFFIGPYNNGMQGERSPWQGSIDTGDDREGPSGTLSGSGDLVGVHIRVYRAQLSTELHRGQWVILWYLFFRVYKTMSVKLLFSSHTQTRARAHIRTYRDTRYA